LKIKFNKIQVAEIQLNEAIFLFFDNAHPLIVETLIGAVVGVLRPLGKKYGINAPAHDWDGIKPEYKKTWINDYLHKAQNFCKHADNDLDEILEYEIEGLPYSIYEACYLYRHIASDKALKYRQSSAALLFELWLMAERPHLLKSVEAFNQLLKSTGMNVKQIKDMSLIKEVLLKYRIKR